MPNLYCTYTKILTPQADSNKGTELYRRSKALAVSLWLSAPIGQNISSSVFIMPIISLIVYFCKTANESWSVQQDEKDTDYNTGKRCVLRGMFLAPS
jgi:hypothetical protein